jgi:hypothetical protein
MSPGGDLATVVMTIRTFTGQMRGDQNAMTAVAHLQIVMNGLVLQNHVPGIQDLGGSIPGKTEDPLQARPRYAKKFAETPWQSECLSHQTPGNNRIPIDLADTNRLSIFS